MSSTNRRYDIDWLRVIAIGLLLIYHIGIGFQPFGVLIGFIQSNKPLESLWVPLSMLNIWRIPLLFFVSGMGVCFAIRKRSWKQLLLERARRILLPFLFGMFAIVPLHIILWQLYYNQEIAYTIHPVHLWFLANIFIYVLLLSPLFFYLKKNENGKIHRALQKLFNKPWGLLVVVAAFVLEAIVVKPQIFETYAMTLHGFIMGLLAFLFGFLFVYSGEAFWRSVSRLRCLTLSLALGLFLFRYIEFKLIAPRYLLAIESNMWIFAAFGFANKYLQKPGKALDYLTQAAYPVYIIHMFFLYLGSFLIMPLDITPWFQLILIVAFTFLGSFALYELLIRRVRFLRPLFGLK
jgi:peptidoglycan/LPS O-acetylase OafA/YrhL